MKYGAPKKRRGGHERGGEIRLLNPPQPPFDKVGSLSVPDAFNIGINDGAFAGQTVPHLHIHLIPRYAVDTDDPKLAWSSSPEPVQTGLVESPPAEPR